MEQHSPLHNTCEIGPLRKVLLHRPGRELENLMPDYLERRVFQNALSATAEPEPTGAADFAAWLADYRRLLPARNQAADVWNS